MRLFMDVLATAIPGVLIVASKLVGDARGFLMEVISRQSPRRPRYLSSLRAGEPVAF
jgi:dTDP-4-dehydrorhamnose 3,5-epimerase-like enzyme